MRLSGKPRNNTYIRFTGIPENAGKNVEAVFELRYFRNTESPAFFGFGILDCVDGVIGICAELCQMPNGIITIATTILITY